MKVESYIHATAAGECTLGCSHAHLPHGDSPQFGMRDLQRRAPRSGVYAPVWELPAAEK